MPQAGIGADDYLVKPVEREELLAAIAARLDRKQAHASNTAATVRALEILRLPATKR